MRLPTPEVEADMSAGVIPVPSRREVDVIPPFSAGAIALTPPRSDIPSYFALACCF